MSAERCLGCYRPLNGEPTGFHPACARKVFGAATPPLLPYTEEDLLRLAEDAVKRSITVTGAQTKMSIGVEQMDGAQERFTIVGVWGSHILKPPTTLYPHLPELEDLTMHLAELAGIRTVPHALLRLRDNELVYITRRVDRQGRPGSSRYRKLHMEDMAQATERITEHKYRGSYEQVAKALRRYADEPNAAIVEFYEQVLFGFLTGNADMHLKNFSLLSDEEGRYRLSPAYDHVPTALVLDDPEELALTLNGRKSRITRADFETAMRAAGLNERAILNLFNRMKKALPKWMEFIGLGFVPEELKERYRALIAERAARMGL
ncbi:MAG: HipA domain-containing protein [Flavobacteriales bacterium]|nr:HipA domain-containing protein [Flavobacteriales bacterium]